MVTRTLLVCSALIVGCSTPTPPNDVANDTTNNADTTLDGASSMDANVPDTFALPDGDPFANSDVPYRPDVQFDGAIPGAASCDNAPTLPLNTRIEGVPSSTAVTPNPTPASCWSGTLSPQLHYAIDIPPWTGVRVAVDPMSGTSQPALYLTDRCAPTNNTECTYFNSGAPTQMAYMGNANSVSRRIIVHVRFPSPDPNTVFGIETQSYPLFSNASCVGAVALPQNTSITTPHGGTDRLCGSIQERTFYKLQIPPLSIARAVIGSIATVLRDCQCTLTPAPTLRNTSDQPRDALVTLGGATTFRWQATSLESNAVCSNPASVTASTPDRNRQTDLAGDSLSSPCGTPQANHLYYRVDIPARTKARLRAVLQQSNADQSLLIWAADGCLSTSTCLGNATSTATNSVTLDVDNQQSTNRVVTVGAAPYFAPVAGNRMDLEVSFIPL